MRGWGRGREIYASVSLELGQAGSYNNEADWLFFKGKSQSRLEDILRHYFRYDVALISWQDLICELNNVSVH